MDRARTGDSGLHRENSEASPTRRYTEMFVAGYGTLVNVYEVYVARTTRDDALWLVGQVG